MTVVWKLLFHSRPHYTGGQSSNPEADPDPVTLDHRDHRNNRQHHRTARLEHQSVKLEHKNSGKVEASSGSRRLAMVGVSRSKVIRNVQLPDAVVQAQARLLKRLRSLSLTESGQTTKVASISWDECPVSNYTKADDFEGLEIETPRDLLEPNTAYSVFSGPEEE